MLISNNIYQHFQSQFHELSDTRNKANLYQILVYDGSHFVNGTVAYLTEDELSKVITEIEQTHYCQVEPLNFYSFNIYDREFNRLNVDPHAKLMTDLEASQLRQGVDPLNLSNGEYHCEISKVNTFNIDKNSTQKYYVLQWRRLKNWLMRLCK
jgi:hypothetical protein